MPKFILFPLALLFAGILRADTITLVSGEKIDGTVLSETDTQVVVQIRISGSITDERTLQRNEIAKIEKVQPDELAYNQIRNIKLDAQSSYPVETYDRIVGALQNFITTYPSSAHKAEVQATLDSINAEKKRVDAGEVKLLGKWIPKQEAEKRKAHILSQQLFAAMRDQASRGDTIGALNTFAALEKSGNNTAAWPSAIELAKPLVARVQQDATTRLASLTSELQQFKKTVAGTPEPQRSQQIAAADREQAQYSASVLAAERSGLKWVPFISRSVTSLSTLQKTAQSEAQRLSGMPSRQMIASIAKTEEAETAITNNDFDGAEKLIADAQQLWPQSEPLQYVTAKFRTTEAAAVATPSPSKPKASAAPVVTAPAPEVTEKPFYMTVTGALVILGGVIVIVGIASAVSHLRARKASQAG